MRWLLWIANVTGLFLSSSFAFVVVWKKNRHESIRPVGLSGWDNDSFLNSLSGSARDREEANDRYFEMSRFPGRDPPDRNQDNNNNDNDNEQEDEDNDDDLLAGQSIPGALFTSEMIQKVKASHTPEEEASGGGKMFREMLERAKQASSKLQPPPPPPPTAPPAQPYYNPLANSVPQQVTPDPSSLSVEDQARLFREMMMMQQQQLQLLQQQQQQQQQPQQSFPQPSNNNNNKNYLPAGVDGSGRRIGRNRDADAIVNTADVYFAQLKRDSTLRNIARWQGDDSRANAVFADPSIQQIKAQVNPFIEEQRAKERELLETSVDEILIPAVFIERPVQPKDYAGISYKDKLAQAKLKSKSPDIAMETKPNTQTTTAAAATQSTAAAAASNVAKTAPEIQPIAAAASNVAKTAPETQPKAAVASNVAKTAPEIQPKAAAASNVAMTMETKTTPDTQPITAASNVPEVAPPVGKDLTATPKIDATDETWPEMLSIASDLSEDETSLKKDIRTLMGLILKHRGGPAFGAGRALKEPEMKQFQSLANHISNVLSQEAKQFTKQSNSPSTVILSKALESAYDRPKEPRERKGEENKSPSTMATTFPRPSTESILSNKAKEPWLSSAPQDDRIGQILSCIEGAIQMYRNAPPELEDGVLTTLRAALLSAVTSCNAILAQREVQNWKLESSKNVYDAVLEEKQMFESAFSQIQEGELRREEQEWKLESWQESESDGEIGQFYESLLDKIRDGELGGRSEATEGPSSSPEPMADDSENVQFYQLALNKIRKAAGDGKMGLKSNLSALEASELAEVIAQVRTRLIQELGNSS